MKDKAQKGSYSALAEVFLLSLIRVLAGHPADQILKSAMEKLPATGFSARLAGSFVEQVMIKMVIAGKEAEAMAAAKLLKEFVPDRTVPKSMDAIRKEVLKDII